MAAGVRRRLRSETAPLAFGERRESLIHQYLDDDGTSDANFLSPFAASSLLVRY
jgi:hypothetical protein